MKKNGPLELSSSVTQRFFFGARLAGFAIAFDPLVLLCLTRFILP